MTTHQTETSLLHELPKNSERLDWVQSKEKNIPRVSNDYETLTNNEIGITNPETSFETFLLTNIKLLRGLGLFSVNFRLSGQLINTNARRVLPVLIVIIQMIFLTICEFRALLRFWKTDPDLGVTAITALLPVPLCAFKGFRLWMCQVELRELLIRLTILWEKSRFQTNVRNKILKIAERTRYVRSWYLAMMTFIATSYGIRPYLLLLKFKLNHNANETYDYSVTSMPAIYPFVIDTFIKYLACTIWEMFIGFFLVMYWASCDTFFAQLVSHTVIQFQVLHYDLKNIATETKFTNSKDERLLVKKLCSIAKRHNELFSHCKLIERIFNPTIFATMFSSAMSMCFCALSVQKAMKNGDHEEVAKNIAHLITVVGQSIIYCGYADNLTHQNFKIAQAAYQCHWIERSASFKINLQIIMMRAQKYYCLSGYGFFHLTLTQITTILKTTMSYFTLLKTLT